MARRPRIIVEGGLCHVCNRVSSGEPVIADPNEAIEFIEIVRDVKRRDGWAVFAWCLMPNHFHLVVRTSSVPLWRGMHGIQNRFSRGFNRRFGRTGGQGGPAVVMEKEPYATTMQKLTVGILKWLPIESQL